MGFFLAQPVAQGLNEVVIRDHFGGGLNGAQHDHVADAAVAELFGHLVAGDRDDRHVGTQLHALDQGGIVEQRAAGGHHGHKLDQAGLVHGHQHGRLADQRAADGLVADHHGAVGFAAAHFGAVAGHPADLITLPHGRLGDQLTDEQHALSAETGNQKLLFHHAWPPSVVISLYTPSG